MKTRNWAKVTFGALAFIAALVIGIQLTGSGRANMSRSVVQERSNTYPLRAVTVEFGVKDHESTRWDGSVTISDGEIVQLRGHHFTDKDKLGPNNSWVASTTGWNAEHYRGVVHLNELPAPRERVLTIGITIYYRAPPDAELGLKTEQGDFSFRPGDVPESAPLHLLVSQVEVFRVPPVEHVTTEDYEDDYPSISTDPDGKVFVAWIGYRNNADEVFFRHRGTGTWSATATVTERPGDLYGTAVAVDGQLRTWVVWSEREGTDWHLKARSFDGQVWSAVRALTSGTGNNLFHRLVADSKGNLHLVWQSAQHGRFDIYYKSMTNRSWSDEINLSDGKKEARVNDWNPDVAVGSKGTAWIAWDSYDQGSYNIRMRSIRSGQPGELMRVTDSPRFHAHPSLAVDAQDRVWIAYDVAEENWGKDTGFLLTGGSGLYDSRAIHISVYDGSRWLAPRDQLDRVIRPIVRRYVQSPQLVPDSKGRMWVLFRPRTTSNRPDTVFALAGKWEVMASYYAGDRWSDPITLPESVGRNEGPLHAVAGVDGAVHAAWVTDQRLFGGSQYGHPPGDNQVVFANMAAEFAHTPVLVAQLGARGSEPPAKLPTEPREKEQVAAVRNYTINAQGKRYGIFRGDLHRHTDISQDGSGDGSLFDSYRYMLDAAAMDLYLVTDHNSGEDQEYTWWRIEKSEDMFHLPGFFVTLFGYERSLSYPNGHRNIIYSQRGNRPLAITKEEQNNSTGPFLYPHLRKTNGIATSHTSHTYMGTDWRDNDPELEPIVEIFQGARTSAEHDGAPLASSEKRTDSWAGGYRPLGFVWKAWEKGYKLGVQASSDHVSTHTSYAMILAEDGTRDGLVYAMRQRHTYGATSNIILDFRARDGSVEYIHGDAYTSPNIPELEIEVIGSNDLQEVVVIRDNKYVYRRTGSGKQLQFTFKESSLALGQHYYYVRVEQKDSNVAWSSPIWVEYQ